MQIKTERFVKDLLTWQLASHYLTDALCPLGVNIVLGDAAAKLLGRPLDPGPCAEPTPADEGPRKPLPPANARADPPAEEGVRAEPPPPDAGVRADDEYAEDGRYCTLGDRGLYDDPELTAVGAALLAA